jgi:uncharacterized protein (TIGR02284 family)
MAIRTEGTTDELKHSISVLNDLIETCKDGEKGFAAAAERAKEAPLKSLFAEYSSQRSQFGRELQSAVIQMNGEPAESGHVAASLHRGWISVKEAVSSDSDKALIDECEAGEDAAMKSYKEALQEPLSLAVKHLIEKQFVGVQAAHGVIRDLKHSR